jgi:hypothetical protein
MPVRPPQDLPSFLPPADEHAGGEVAAMPTTPIDSAVGEENEGRPATARWIDPVGLAALLVGVAALLAAAVTLLGGWVIPLSIVGLLTGLAAVVRARASDKARLPLPITGAAANGVILVAAWLFPGLLGPAYLASRDKGLQDPAAIRVVPLPGSPASVAAESPDWIDASRAALQQGGLRLQVVSAWVGPAEEAPPKKKGTREEYLFIRLRTRQVQDAGPSDSRSAPPERRDVQHHPTLTDNTGKVYQERKGPERVESGATSSKFPLAIVDEVLAFEPPSAGREYLRLEVPAAGWGRPGAFRFTVPNTMVNRPRPGRRPGG